jgi:hypothetical protein
LKDAALFATRINWEGVFSETFESSVATEWKIPFGFVTPIKPFIQGTVYSRPRSESWRQFLQIERHRHLYQLHRNWSTALL